MEKDTNSEKLIDEIKGTKAPLYNYKVGDEELGYSKQFKEHLEFINLPEPLNLHEMIGLKKPTFWRVLKDAFVQGAKNIKKFFKEILPSWFKKIKTKTFIWF